MRIPTRSGTTSRGQAAVEFALVLSLLILLLVLAVDMGRAFFGSVGLHNVARIAASEASARPDAWEPPGSAADQTAYRQTVLEDLQAIGCERPGGGAFTAADVPDPVFENKAATSFSSDIYEVGDHVSVYLECDLQPITPIASAILGGDVSIAAQAEFPVRGGTNQRRSDRWRASADRLRRQDRPEPGWPHRRRCAECVDQRAVHGCLHAGHRRRHECRDVAEHHPCLRAR